MYIHINIHVYISGYTHKMINNINIINSILNFTANYKSSNASLKLLFWDRI